MLSELESKSNRIQAALACAKNHLHLDLSVKAPGLLSIPQWRFAPRSLSHGRSDS